MQARGRTLDAKEATDDLDSNNNSGSNRSIKKTPVC